LKESDTATAASEAQGPLPGPDEEALTQPDAIRVEPETQPRRGGLRLLREIIETVLLTLVIFVIINTVTGRFRIEGPSMKPNLQEGQYLIINKIVYRLNPPGRGDIVVFHHPRNPKRDLIKRVIGLPGEAVEVRQDQVLIDGAALEEPYVLHQGGRSIRLDLGPDDYLVLGDNRPNSDDSRNWGVLKRDQIVGKAWISYWPPSDWGGVPHYSYPEIITAQEQ
jgi:signal peptidase I